MSKKTSSIKSQSERDLASSGQCQAERSAKGPPADRRNTEAASRNGDAASSSPDSGSLNGESKRGAKSRQRKKRPANLDKCPKGNQEGGKTEEKRKQPTGSSCERADAWTGLQSECASVWFERGVYERAESLYHSRVTTAPRSAARSKPTTRSAGKRSNNVAPTSPNPACQDGDRVSPRQIKQEVPNSLVLPASPRCPAQSTTPDEGYQSSAPTPATPAAHPPATTTTSRQSINGLPCIPVELLREVWLDKPRYDRAEAAFYQNLYGNNAPKRSSSSPRPSEPPQSLAEEEEVEEEEPVKEKPAVLMGKAEVFHALHPIQEEEEPADLLEAEEETPGIHFLHLDSERVWLDKWRYDAAESRFHGNEAAKANAAKKGSRAAASAPPKTARRDKKMTSTEFLAKEKIWFDKPRYDEAERCFYEHKNGTVKTKQDVGANSILQDIARARENIQKSLAGLKSTLCNSDSAHPPPNHQSECSPSSSPAEQGEIISRIKNLEVENQSLHRVVDDIRAALSRLECRVSVLEKSPAAPAPARINCTNGSTVAQRSKAPAKTENDDDDDIDLFGSDEDDEEAEKLKEQRLKEYAAKKAKKPAIIAKSSILLDVKPWDDETDMAKLEECVRSVQADGLLWGMSKLVPVGYGIKKLQIACVVEDDKVGTDLLEEEITKFEDFVQSVDVAAFNKI